MAVVKINAIEVPEGAGEQLEARFAQRAAAVDGTPGFLGFELLRPTGGETRYFVYTRWDSEDSYRAWAADGAGPAHAGAGGQRPAPVATGASLLEFDVVLRVEPTEG